MKPPTGSPALLLGVILALATPIQPAYAQTQQTGPVALRTGIVIDPARGVAHVGMPDGQIAAIDMATGATRWTSDAGALPIALVGDILVSQVQPDITTSSVAFVGLNVVERGEATVRGNIDLPPNVRPSIGETLHGTFSVRGVAAGNDVQMTWAFEPAPLRGQLDEEDEGQDVSELRVTGALQFRTTTGELDAMDPDEVGLPPAPEWIARGETRFARPGAATYTSANGRHLLVTERVADDGTWLRYRWTVYDQSSGQEVGETMSHVAFAPFFVHDTVLVFETTPYERRGEAPEPAKLRGVNLESGGEVWSVPVRELVFRGPYPP